MTIIVCKREESAKVFDRIYWTAKGDWTHDRAKAKEYGTRGAALADHPRALQAPRPAGYRTPTAVER